MHREEKILIGKFSQYQFAAIEYILSHAYRVKTFWSCMVIKPYTSIDEPGIEFGLTYFEDPGVNVPSTITSWVTISGI